MDDVEGEIPTKNRQERFVPICEHLRAYLHEPGEGRFYFGGDTPLDYDKTTRRAYKAWEDGGLDRFTPHEGRHSFLTFLDAVASISDVRAKRYAGHSDKSMTSRYTHPFEAQAPLDAAALDEWLSRDAAPVVSLPIVGRSVAQ